MEGKILIVEDDQVLVELLSYFVESDGIHVVSAPDGMTGLHILKHDTDIKLVICDLNMPRMGGMGFLNECGRAHPWCPVIILTGDPESAKQQDISNKAFAVMPKPFDSFELLKNIHAGLTVSDAQGLILKARPGIG